MKKLIVLGMLLIISFLFVGCNKNELSKCKDSASIELQSYADSKGKENYNQKNLLILENYVFNGIEEIKSASSEEIVNAILEKVKFKIDCILNLEDLEYMESIGLGALEELDPEIEFEIMNFYYGENYRERILMDGWRLNNYYGVYNGYVIYNSPLVLGWSGNPSTIIGDFLFICEARRGKFITWKDGEQHLIDELYEKGILKNQDIEKMYMINIVYYSEYYKRGITEGFLLKEFQNLYFNYLYFKDVEAGIMTISEYQNLHEKYIDNDFEEMLGWEEAYEKFLNQIANLNQ